VRLRIAHRTHYNYSVPAHDSRNELHLRPLTDDSQCCIAFALSTTPLAFQDEWSDRFGNTVHSFTVADPHTQLEVVSQAIVDTFRGELMPPCDPGLGPSLGELKVFSFAAQHTVFLGPSRYVPSMAELRTVVWSLLQGPSQPVTAVLQTLFGWVRRECAYEPGISSVQTDLRAVLQTRRGVCQDFAHLFVGLVRAAGIPARYVGGYVFVPGETSVAPHAWAEVLVPGLGWWSFDPTTDGPFDQRYVKVAVGRDYQDVAPLSGELLGGGMQTLTATVTIDELPTSVPPPLLQ
jgi:transglutaminase-like putative cysteine protease